MKLSEAKHGSYVRRKNVNNITKYIISISLNGVCRFMNQEDTYSGKVFSPTNFVDEDSVVWKHNDYVYCDRKGNIKKEYEMKERDVNYIGGEYNVVMCEYELNGKLYAFKIDASITPTIDDMCVVESSAGYGVCTIKEFYENNIDNAEIIGKAAAWVVDIVDMTTHKGRQDATKKREYLIKQLEEKKKSLEVVDMYMALAAIDPEAKKLVDQLKALT